MPATRARLLAGRRLAILRYLCLALSHLEASAWVEISVRVVDDVVVRGIVVSQAACFKKAVATGKRRLALVHGDGVRGQKVRNNKLALRINRFRRVELGQEAQCLRR